MDFLIAGLVFLLLILAHYMNRERIENMNSKVFQIFIIVGIADIVLDILCTILITKADPDYAVLMRLMLTCLYLLQATVPYALFTYIKSLCPAMQNAGPVMKLLDIPAIVMWILIICNLWSGMFFTVHRDGTYTRGAYYLGMYGYALFYALVIMVGSIIRRRTLGKRKFTVIWEFILIMVTCVLVQAYKPDFLMTGFGIGLGIMVMFLTLNNPCEYIDTTTRAFNLQCFVDWVREQMNGKRTFHVLVVELSQIKKINKLYGAGFGDGMLYFLTQSLRQIAATPYVFRITGKRFAIVTQSLGEYERIRDEVEAFFKENIHVGGEEVRCPAVLCGIINAEEQKNSDELLFYIEYLLSLVPSVDETIMLQGDEKTMQGLRYTKTVEQYLQTAIDEDLFEVYYQPVYSLESGKFVTLEALSRLRHPTLGMVSPEVFIDIAEKNGRITDLSYLQFRRVCRFLKENPELMKQIRNVKFNLSPMELMKAGSSKRLIGVIEEYGLPFEWFQFEITETVATEYSDRLFQAVGDFTERGIGMCLDDFGSGYANLDTVLKLPFSSIKLDRSLLNGIMDDPKSALFYKNIVSVLQNLGYWVISEGVEEEREEKLLREWGVNLIQGYYFAKPMPEKELLKLILGKQEA